MTRLGRSQLAMLLGIKPRTVDAWARRGHVTRHPDGYDPGEVLSWWENETRQKMAAVVSCRLDGI